jgi:hypothetical protein
MHVNLDTSERREAVSLFNMEASSFCKNNKVLSRWFWGMK